MTIDLEIVLAIVLKIVLATTGELNYIQFSFIGGGRETVENRSFCEQKEPKKL